MLKLLAVQRALGALGNTPASNWFVTDEELDRIIKQCDLHLQKQDVSGLVAYLLAEKSSNPDEFEYIIRHLSKELRIEVPYNSNYSAANPHWDSFIKQYLTA